MSSSADIPDRAAWLDVEVEWVGDPSMFEIQRLDLGDVILTEGQIDIKIPKERASINVLIRDVEVTSINEEKSSLTYIVTGERWFAQSWDLGGANLSSPSERENFF